MSGVAPPSAAGFAGEDRSIPLALSRKRILPAFRTSDAPASPVAGASVVSAAAVAPVVAAAAAAAAASAAAAACCRPKRWPWRLDLLTHGIEVEVFT